jgi:hypothetical protein
LQAPDIPVGHHPSRGTSLRTLALLQTGVSYTHPSPPFWGTRLRTRALLSAFASCWYGPRRLRSAGRNLQFLKWLGSTLALFYVARLPRSTGINVAGRATGAEGQAEGTHPKGKHLRKRATGRDTEWVR